MKYLYVKECVYCGLRYFKKEISKEVFDSAMEQPAIGWGTAEEADLAIMFSCCPECAEEYQNWEKNETTPGELTG